MTRNTTLNFRLLILAFLAVFGGFAGCASLGAGNSESLLSAAGFRTRAPSTKQQIAMYNALPPNRLERRQRNGKVLYTYADKQKGVVYIGGEAEYQRYKQLGAQQSIAESQLQAAEINQETVLDWQLGWGSGWDPWGTWW
jgi:hypothetical protein